jgi:hypothetical protein
MKSYVKDQSEVILWLKGCVIRLQNISNRGGITDIVRVEIMIPKTDS